MALLKSTSGPAPVEPEIPVLDNHPEFVRVATLRRSILSAREERQRQLDLLAVEAELARSSGGSGTGQRAKMLRDQADRLRAAAPKPTAAKPVTDTGLPATVTRALALVQGGDIAPAPDRAERLKKLRSDLAVFEAALPEVDELLSEIRATQSVAVAQSLRPQNEAMLRTIYGAAQALSAAISAERALCARYLAAGYEDRPDIVHRPSLSSANRLGSTDEWDSEINTFRRRLELLKVI